MLYDVIHEFRSYQIAWLTNHCDIELNPDIENLIIRFLQDTADCFISENKNMDLILRSDVLDLFGHGTTYTSEEAQKMINNLVYET